jgi:hypothetical protein
VILAAFLSSDETMATLELPRLVFALDEGKKPFKKLFPQSNAIRRQSGDRNRFETGAAALFPASVHARILFAGQS